MCIFYFTVNLTSILSRFPGANCSVSRSPGNRDEGWLTAYLSTILPSKTLPLFQKALK